jgi:molybdate transport system ATP-binding protein
MSFFAVEDLLVRLDGFALRGTSFALSRGDYLSVVGPSGAGKSVLLNAIAGFHSLAGGRIALDGREVSGLPPERRGIGIVYQDYALFPHLSVFENIAYGLMGGERDHAKRQVVEMAEALGLQRVLGKRPESLSGGERQRTALARALVVRPRLLLMDEPFSALDPPARRELRRLVRRLVEETGTTVIHVAHDLDDMWSLADMALVMENGTVTAFGAVNAVLGPPATAFLRRAEGVRVVAGTAVERHRGVTVVDAAGVRLATSDPAEPGEKVRLVLRPEDVTLYTDAPASTSARNVLRGRVTGVHHIDETALVGIQSDGLEFSARLTADAVENLALSVGRSVVATIKAVHLNIG